MDRSQRGVSYRARDLWWTAATAVPLGVLTGFVLASLAGGHEKALSSLPDIIAIGGLVGPIGALGGGFGLLVAYKLRVQRPWLRVALVAFGAGAILWLGMVAYAAAGLSDHELTFGSLRASARILIAIFPNVMLAGAIPAGLAFGVLSGYRYRNPPPPGTEWHPPTDLDIPDTVPESWL